MWKVEQQHLLVRTGQNRDEGTASGMPQILVENMKPTGGAEMATPVRTLFLCDPGRLASHMSQGLNR